MRRVIIVISVVLIISGILWLLARDPDGRTLADGTRLSLVDTRLGAKELPPIRIGFWQNLGEAAPEKFQKWLPGLMKPSFSAGGSSMWVEVPDPTNTLQIVFTWEGESNISKDYQLSTVIRDSNGQAWYPSTQNVREIAGPNDRNIHIHVYHFAAFPRWQDQFKIQIDQHPSEHGGQTTVAEFVAENPSRVRTPHSWDASSLPTVSETEELHVTLESFQINKSLPSHLSPLTWIISSFEPNNPTGSNAWYVAKAAVWDNFGNNAFNGLPLQLPQDASNESHQWRVLLDLVADHRSHTASNVFLSLDQATFPEAGQVALLFSGPTNQNHISIDGVQFIGAGEMTFSDGRLLTNNAVVPTEPGLKRKARRRTAADGTMTRVITLKNPSPVLALRVDGASDSTWFSCRAEGQASGEVYWLDVRRPPKVDRPQFSRLVNQGKLVYYSLEKLNPEEEWQFTFGVHPIHQAEFFIDRPTATTNERAILTK